MVSILLAACNGAAYLPGQLASLEAQRIRDFRILWQDDGSTDDTPELLAAMGQRYTPGCQQGHHLGAAGNFLSLMAQDDAPYTALCDQDDLWRSDRLLRGLDMLQSAEEQYGADTPLLVHSDARLISADGSLLHDSFFRHQGWQGSAVTLPRLLVQNNVTGCTILMNAALRRLVVQHAKAEQLYMHDWFIALTAAAFGHILFISEPLVDYRQHGTNVMGASRHGLLQRSLSALAVPRKAHARIRLTYDHARMFRDAYDDCLPPEAARCIDQYLSTASQQKLHRVFAVQRGGYTMQSIPARLGQILFG